MTWFEELTDLDEKSPEQVRCYLTVDGKILTSLANRRSFQCGYLETPSLEELRHRVNQLTPPYNGQISVTEVLNNVKNLHADAENAGCLFQVASQFNLLEMVDPFVTPEEGVGIYEQDGTQGPGCAIAAGAGTIYRNYFAVVNGKIGQTYDNQIDCLADLGRALGNYDNRLWRMQNGYALASRAGLEELSERFGKASSEELELFKNLLRVGMQWDTQVTIRNCTHTVTQVYCSALPVAYSEHPPKLWANFAKLVLNAAYEATLCAAILNFENTQNKTVFLTRLGGGAFGNASAWIDNAIIQALYKYRHWDLDVRMVSLWESRPATQKIVDLFANV